MGPFLPWIIPRDLVQNTNRGFRHYIRDRKFVRETLSVTDGFLETHIPEFDLSSYGKIFDSLLDTFLFINTRVREDNSRYVLETVARNTVNTLVWKGKFLRMAGAATRAGFGDRRIYKYKGKEAFRWDKMSKREIILA